MFFLRPQVNTQKKKQAPKPYFKHIVDLNESELAPDSQPLAQRNTSVLPLTLECAVHNQI